MSRHNSRAALFLGEVLLALLIFALSSAVCVGLFFSSYRISRSSSELNQAVFAAQNAAEAFKADPEFRTLVTQLSTGKYEAYYDENWQSTEKADSVFTQSVALRREAGVLYADISILKGGTIIYELTAAAYAGEGER